MTTTRTRLLIALALLLACAAPALAHPGGHGVAVGESLHVWVNDTTGESMIGTLSFVTGSDAHLEDGTGRIHVWPLASLNRADRALASAFRRRVDDLNGTHPPITRTAPPAASPLLWLLVAGALTAALLFRATRMRHAMLRIPR